jgi:hypothetical protein
MMLAMAFLLAFAKALTFLLYAAFATLGALSAAAVFIALFILCISSIASSSTRMS